MILKVANRSGANLEPPRNEPLPPSAIGESTSQATAAAKLGEEACAGRGGHPLHLAGASFGLREVSHMLLTSWLNRVE